ncbi:hypothetical protein AWB77_06817 [Caballeronia fortuita]|uniref:Uncharacterized protein n=1 Tax=Caballeronia fortuita TaxID=1777138 RepID=A0A158E9V3_9BURK|nr:hypothetical protein AWB77_06817 [Caballeronia fortuita]
MAGREKNLRKGLAKLSSPRHNLVSLLPMQRRKTVVGFDGLAMCSLKTNSR